MDSQGSLDSQDSQDSVMTIIDESKREILYFAYGGDLSTERMRQKCPFSTPIGLGHLGGWRWIVNQKGCANVIPVDAGDQGKGKGRDKGDKDELEHGGVYGLLYLLPTQDEETLDVLEGVPRACEKVHLEVSWLVDGQGKLVVEDDSLTLVKALVYVDTQSEQPMRRRGSGESGPAEEEYVDELERGIRDVVENWGFPEDYAERVMRPYWR